MEKLSSNGLPGARKFGDRCSKAKETNAGLGSLAGRGCRGESQKERMGHQLYLQTSSSQKTSIFVIPDLNTPCFHSLLSEKRSTRLDMNWTVIILETVCHWHLFEIWNGSCFYSWIPFFLKKKKLKWKDPTVPDLWYILICIPFLSLCLEVV